MAGATGAWDCDGAKAVCRPSDRRRTSVTGNAPPGSVLGISILGLNEFTTGFDLTSLGMPTCNLYASLDATNTIPLSGGSGTLTLPIPSASSFAGIVLRSQGAVFAPGINPFGFVTSNGVRLTLDIN